MHFEPWLMVKVLFTFTPLGVNENFCVAFPVHAPTVTSCPFTICRHWPSIMEVMVPLVLMFHAPLHAHVSTQFFGKSLQPQLQLTAAFGLQNATTSSEERTSAESRERSAESREQIAAAYGIERPQMGCCARPLEQTGGCSRSNPLCAPEQILGKNSVM